MKEILKSIWKKKYVGGIILAILSIFSVVYYTVAYCKENTLLFTEEHKFMLFLLAAICIMVSILYITVAIMYNKLKTQNDLLQDKVNIVYVKLCELFDNSIESEDNLIKVSRSESMNIIKTINGRRGDDNDKRS